MQKRRKEAIIAPRDRPSGGMRAAGAVSEIPFFGKTEKYIKGERKVLKFPDRSFFPPPVALALPPLPRSYILFLIARGGGRNACLVREEEERTCHRKSAKLGSERKVLKHTSTCISPQKKHRRKGLWITTQLLAQLPALAISPFVSLEPTHSYVPCVTAGKPRKKQIRKNKGIGTRFYNHSMHAPIEISRRDAKMGLK